MRQTFNVLFFIRKTRALKSGENPIMLRISIAGQLAEIQAFLIKYILFFCEKTIMNCPKCTCVRSVKSGVIKGRQRFKCKECGCNYTVELKSTAKSKSIKKQALHLYLEGLGFRSIGRYLGVSNVSVLNWIRSFGEKVQQLNQESQEIEMVEADEMHSYIGSKKLLPDMDCC